MRNQKLENYAFIDSQNLNLSIQKLGWKLDFKRFRVYLKDKYQVEKAFIFIGYISGNEPLYTFLQKAGYLIVFKPTLEYKKNKKCFTKGNVDAELVLYTMIEFKNYNKAIIISGDGDFHCLIEYLIGKNKLKKIIIPDQKRCSVLLKRFPSEYLAFVSDLHKKLEYKKRTH